MRKYLIIVVAIFAFGLLSTGKAYGQYTNYGSRWYGGGSFGLSFGTTTSVTVSPEVAYAVTDDFFVGGGIRFSYYKDNRFTPVYESTVWGGKLFLRYYLFSDFFAHVEYQRLYFKDPYYVSPIGSEWTFNDYFYGGGGYRSWVGSNSYLSFELLFNLSELDQLEFGINPFIRIGFGVGF
jgi:hypothetical protein